MTVNQRGWGVPRSRVKGQDAKAISQRLKDFVAKRYGSWEAFYKGLSISRTTADAWRGKTPSVPDPLFLLHLGREANVNLDWLLLGRGHELFEYSADTPAERVENAIEAELRNTEDATFGEFGAAWDRLHYRGDFSQRENVVLQLAVEGVRPRFQENLRMVRHYAGVMHVVNEHIPHVLAEGGPEGEKRADRFRRLMREALLDLKGSADRTEEPRTEEK